jgi:hypothetical protein
MRPARNSSTISCVLEIDIQYSSIQSQFAQSAILMDLPHFKQGSPRAHLPPSGSAVPPGRIVANRQQAHDVCKLHEMQNISSFQLTKPVTPRRRRYDEAA